MINIRNLNKSYESYGKVVLDNINLQIQEGKITCVLGQSGAGKTTLLNAVCGLINYSGQIDDVQCSYAFNKPNLFANLTVKDNLLLVNKDLKQVEEMLKKLCILDKINSFPNHLSAGQAQRVSLARAMLYQKPLLLLDEPFSNLDVGLKFLLIDRIKEVQKKQNNTILMVTHDIKEAVSIADRILVLSKGKIIYDNDKIEKKTEKEIFALLIGLVNID